MTALDRQIPALLQKYRGAAALGLALVRDGQVTFSSVWGEREAGVPADSTTLFNVASITKTVTAETILRLVAAGRISLDEPMAPYWVEPDVASDPRHLQLTPRLVLTHQTGFPNWRRMNKGGKLAFLADPGTKFTYYGEGMNYLARFAERKLGRSFETWLRSTSSTRSGWLKRVSPSAPGWPAVSRCRSTRRTRSGNPGYTRGANGVQPATCSSR